MSGEAVRVTGEKEVIDALRGLRDPKALATITRASEKASLLQMEADAKALAPEKTGRLRDSIGIVSRIVNGVMSSHVGVRLRFQSRGGRKYTSIKKSLAAGDDEQNVHPVLYSFFIEKGYTKSGKGKRFYTNRHDKRGEWRTAKSPRIAPRNYIGAPFDKHKNKVPSKFGAHFMAGIQKRAKRLAKQKSKKKAKK